MTTYDPSKYKHKPSEKRTLEEVLKSLQDLIRNDLIADKGATPPTENAQAASAEEKPQPATHGREDFAATSPEAGPVNLDAVMRSLKDLVNNELDVGDEAERKRDEPAPPAASETNETGEDLAAEFAPLDETLTFEEEMEIVPPPLATPVMPELPGEISEELFAEPEPAPPDAPQAEPAKEVTAGTQQEFLLEAPLAPEPPPIKINESFDEHASIETVTPEAEIPLPETPDTAPATEIPAEAENASANAATTIEEQAPAEEIVAAPPPEPEAPPTEITLETINEPAAETPPPSVDFDTLDSAPPEPQTAPAPVESPAPEEPVLASGHTDAPQTAEETRGMEQSPAAQPVPTETPPFSLDDIPVLQDVVAPPAGSRLTVESTSPPAQPSPPSPNRARDIAVRTVAKLNIEMRKHGGVGLDTKTILRLQQLIREELEKDDGK